MASNIRQGSCGVVPVSIFRDTRVNYVMRRLGEATDEFFDALLIKLEDLMPQATKAQRIQKMTEALGQTVSTWTQPVIKQRTQRLLELARDFEPSMNAAFAIYVKDTYANDIQGKNRKVQICMPRLNDFVHSYFMRIVVAPEVRRGSYFDTTQTHARNFAVSNAFLDALADSCVDNVRVSGAAVKASRETTEKEMGAALGGSESGEELGESDSEGESVTTRRKTHGHYTASSSSSQKPNHNSPPRNYPQTHPQLRAAHPPTASPPAAHPPAAHPITAHAPAAHPPTAHPPAAHPITAHPPAAHAPAAQPLSEPAQSPRFTTFVPPATSFPGPPPASRSRDASFAGQGTLQSGPEAAAAAATAHQNQQPLKQIIHPTPITHSSSQSSTLALINKLKAKS